MDSSPLARHLSRANPSIQPPNPRRRLKSESSQAWTSARCQRLLRQLQARLAALRRSRYQQVSERSTKTKREAGRDHATTTTTTTTVTTSKRVRLTYGQRDRPLASAPGADATTTPPPRPKRALKAMRPDQSSPASGPASFRTPLWNRIRARTETPFHDAGKPHLSWIEEKPFEEVPSHISGRMYLLKQALPDVQHRLYEAILEWVNALLHSTAPPTQGVNPKSLLAMCLRRVPACIASIEAWDRRQVADQGLTWDSSLVAFDMYDQLEGFGLEGHGWRPLSLVVRSHAMSILSDAVSEGLFHPVFAGLLIRLCTHLGYVDGAVRLACSIREALPEPRGPGSRLHDNLRLGPLYSLVQSAAQSTGPVMECLTTLVKDRRLPCEWLCTSGFTGLWASNLLTMTSSSARPSEFRFKQTALVVLLAQCEHTAQDPKKYVAERTLLGLVAGTTAVLLSVEAGTKERPSGVGVGKQACRRLIHLLESSTAQARRLGCRSGLFILTLARCLATMDSCVIDDAYRQQAAHDFRAMAAGIRAGADKDARYRRMISLVYEILLCLRRSLTFVGLGEMSGKLDRLCLPSQFVTAVRKDVAFMVAKQTKSLQDLAFAESLPSASENSGWRWEEGISEWVVDPHRVEAGPAPTTEASSPAPRKKGLRSQSRKQEASVQGRATQGSCAGTSRSQAAGSDLSRGQRRGIRRSRRVNPPAPAAPQVKTRTAGERPSLIRTRIRPALASLPQARAAGDECDDDDELL